MSTGLRQPSTGPSVSAYLHQQVAYRRHTKTSVLPAHTTKAASLTERGEKLRSSNDSILQS